MAAALALAGCGGGGGSKSTTANGATNGASTSASSPGPAPSAGQESNLQDAFVSAVKTVGPQVVQISTSQGLGSGVVFDGDGHIVTNAHVVGSATSVQVTAYDGHRYSAKVLGSFAPDDLAVVAASGAHLKPATFADSSKLQVGDMVLAVGNPLGLRSSVTNGIVSALGRTVPEPGGGVIASAIQTSAAINPGNSGGALVDLAGHVIGIPTLAAVDPELGGSAAPGIGFAIPSNTARDIAQQIVKSGHVTSSHRAYLGVELAGTFGGQGTVVADVVKGGPAERAGIRRGDVIVAVNGQPTPTPEDLQTALATLRPGQKVPVEVVSPNGQKRKVTVTLGEFPANGG